MHGRPTGRNRDNGEFAADMTKVMTIVGTRPELIRLSRVIELLSQSVKHVLVHTGQNYDHKLNEIFFEELEIPRPNHVLDTNTESLGTLLGTMISESERVLLEERPDAVLILGDTNSALAAIIAKRLRIPVYHMEAGNRCFDENVPEETNRRLVDHIADFNLVYTEHARRHLLSEGLPHRRIYLTGSPMKEVLDYYAEHIDASPIIEELGLERARYFVASMHREENVDDSDCLRKLVAALTTLAEKSEWPIIVSTHPRTRRRLKEFGLTTEARLIRFEEPFGFFAYNKLQKNAAAVLSDSGTVTEESALLGFPAVTIRSSMERPEGLDTGAIVLTGLEPEKIVSAVEAVVEQRAAGLRPPTPRDYMVDNVSQRVVNLILGTAHLSNHWAGVRTRKPA